MGHGNRTSRRGSEKLIFGLAAGAVLLALGAASCVSPVDGADSTVPATCAFDGPLIEPQKTDILFVVDNSGSMAEEQLGVSTETIAFVEELKKGGGVAQDFHLGVITTSLYRNVAELPDGGVLLLRYPSQSGKLQPVPVDLDDGGTAPGTERFLSGDDVDVVAKFSKLIRVGTNGSGQETPFETVRLALELANTPVAQGGNGGFFRDGARLLVVVLTDEDDCSERARDPQVILGRTAGPDYCGDQADKLTPVDEYFSIFNGLTGTDGARKEVLWATIGPVAKGNKSAGAFVTDAGLVQNVDCPSSLQPGPRHRRMAELFDSSLSNLSSICLPDYKQTMLDIAAIANSSQSLEVRGIPDPALMQVEIVRRDGLSSKCTVGNGLSYEPAEGDRPAKLFFEGTCRRRADDTRLALNLLCAG